MATASVSASTSRYNINGGSWQGPVNNQIIIGTSSSTYYRSYFTLNLTNYTTSITSASLVLQDTTDYGSSGKITIGLRTSAPSGNFDESDFNDLLSDNITITRQSTNTISLSSAQRNTLNKYLGKTVYVCLLGNSGQYFEFGVSGSYQVPTLNFEYSSYTKCTAPTLTVPSNLIVTPNGEVTVQWSGASGGTNNSIVGYTVYWRVTSGGSLPTTSTYTGSKNVTSTSTAGSTTITLSNATRGYKVTFGIVTRGEAGSSYYSSISTNNNKVTINSLPSAPSVASVSKTSCYVGEQVTITLNAGTDVDEGQSCRVYYATSSGGTKTLVGNSASPTLTISSFTNTTTYYFWTYDGLEYSSTYVTQKITRKKPVVTIQSSTVQTIMALGGDGDTTGDSGYCYGWANAVTPSVIGTSSGTLTWNIQFHVTGAGLSQFNVQNSSQEQTTTISSTTSKSLGKINIDSLAAGIYQNLSTSNKFVRWRLKCMMNDGYGDSDPLYYPEDGYYYAIPGASPIVASWNQFDTSDIDTSISGNMGNEIRLQIYKDESIINYDVTAESGGAGYKCNIMAISEDVDEIYKYIDVELANRPAGNSSITFKVSTSNQNITKVCTGAPGTKTICRAPNMGSITYSAVGNYKPYSSVSQTDTLSIAWPFTGAADLNDAIELYELRATNPIYLVYSPNTNGEVEKYPTFEDDIVDTLYCDISINPNPLVTITNWDSILGIDETGRSGVYNYNLIVRVVNVYGIPYDTSILVRQVDFNEAPFFSGTPTIKYSLDGESWSSLGTNDKLQEGIKLSFGFTINTFTAGPMSLTLVRTDTNEILGQLSLTRDGTSSPSDPEQDTYTIETDYLKEITTDQVSWTLTALYSNSTINPIAQTGINNSLKHTTPTFSFDDCTAEVTQGGQYSFTYSATVSDKGYTNNTGSYNYYISDQSSIGHDITASFQSDAGTVNSTSSTLDWEVMPLYFHIQTTVIGLVTNTKDFFSSSLIVYQLQPTIAYRKNYLGINTKTPLNDAILDIHTITNRNRIYLNGLNGSFYLFVDEPVDISTTSTPNIIGNRGLAFDNNGVKVPVITIESNNIATFTGNVIGDIQGNITGNLTGDVTGNVSGTASNITGTLGYAHGGTNATSLDSARQNFGFDFTKSVASGNSINFTVAANTHALIFSTGGNGSNTKCMWLINTAGGTSPTPTYAEVFNGGSTATVSASANKFTVNNGTTATMYFGIIVLGGSIT